MATPGRNFCIAPFTQLTFTPLGSYSPCAEIGGRAWTEVNSSPVKMWSSQDFESLRTEFKSNNKPETCNRCWDQEDSKNQSLRQRLLAQGSFFKQGQAADYINQKYQAGPQQINLITSNNCNLRCRICKAEISWTYNIEGRVYEKALGKKTIYTSNSAKPIHLTQVQLDEIYEISGNLQRLEMYGGEPLLDTQTLKLLKRLVDNNRSHEISIMYNTNGVNLPTDKHFELWQHFKQVEFNLSIDDIGHRFTYNRHPAKWEDLLTTINFLKHKNSNFNLFSICTVSVLNVYYLPEIFDKLDSMGLKVFINHVHGPKYYGIEHLPTQIKTAIKHKLKNYHTPSRIEFLLNMLDQPEDLATWEEFKYWTLAKDQYRGESFSETYPEFFSIIKDYDNTIPF
jgi:MoaA/NifB/PqqE/SkfB family radical SAM enzyme